MSRHPALAVRLNPKPYRINGGLQLSKPDKTLDQFPNMRLRDLPNRFEAIPEGMASTEGKKRLHLHGPNSLDVKCRFAAGDRFPTGSAALYSERIDKARGHKMEVICAKRL